MRALLRRRTAVTLLTLKRSSTRLQHARSQACGEREASIPAEGSPPAATRTVLDTRLEVDVGQPGERAVDRLRRELVVGEVAGEIAVVRPHVEVTVTTQ